MRRLSTGVVEMLGRVGQKMMTGSAWALLVGLMAAFGLFWLGLALHWVLAPAAGMFWAWLIPALVYFLAAGGLALAVFGRTGDYARPAERQGDGPSSLPLLAEQLGLELGRGVEREVRLHPLRSVSLAALGGAVLGASPELRRTLLNLLAGRDEESRRR